MTAKAAEKPAGRSARLGVFHHHIYEYKKGLRNLILYTGRSDDRRQIEERLAREGIACLVREVTPGKINVFFGAPVCIQVIKSFGAKPLAAFTGEEDFMLGIMLGYDRLKQCERYLGRPHGRGQIFFTQNIS
ncbi:MAG: DUF2023 family protein [Spirochaetales bacterium]|jgi:hypothetical protein|nr:DUF2023 family protein [Spirochaetales bacterium]